MKKGIEWFAYLSEKEQKEFRENVKKQDDNFHDFINDEYRLFEYFITLAFWFDETPQGHDYWMKICKRDVK
jgi:hypothetical protein